jgi:hypothetical protein
MLGNDRGMAIFCRFQQIWELVSGLFGSSARCFSHNSLIQETVQHRTVLCQALAGQSAIRDRLIGSLRIVAGAADPLADIRSNANALWGRKLALHEAQLTAEVVYVAERLYAIAERGDRLIAATAVALDLSLIRP